MSGCAAAGKQRSLSIPLVTDPEPALAPNEGEVTSELQEEGLQMVNEGLLEVILGVLVSEAEELEDEGVADLAISVFSILELRPGTTGEHRGLVPRQGCALVEPGRDLTVELTDGPASPERLGLVEVSRFGGAGSTNEQHVVRPGRGNRPPSTSTADFRDGVPDIPASGDFRDAVSGISPCLYAR